ncbi:MAG: hypothetical protein ACP5I3_11910, partial [Thermoproteus sp.]
MLLGFLEEYIFGFSKFKGRSVLYVCNEGSPIRTGQIYVEDLYDVLDGILYSAATGNCSVRRSIQPRLGDINTVPEVIAVSLDIDAEVFSVAKKLAAMAADIIKALGAQPLVVFTGGKGYAVLTYLSEEYRQIGEQTYKALAEALREPLPEAATVEIPPIKGLVKVPFTRHEKTKNLVLLYDPERDKHIDDVQEATDALLKAEDSPLPYIERLVEKKEEERKPPAAVFEPADVKNGYGYLERLWADPSKLNDCLKRAAILIALYKGRDEESALAAAQDFLR